MFLGKQELTVEFTDNDYRTDSSPYDQIRRKFISRPYLEQGLRAAEFSGTWRRTEVDVAVSAA